MNIVTESLRLNTDNIHTSTYLHYIQYMPVSHNNNTNSSSDTNQHLLISLE